MSDRSIISKTSSNLLRSGIVLALLLLCFAADAQTSRLGRFKVDEVKGCAPLTVTITNANLITSGECTGTKACLMDYDGTGSQQNQFTHTYSVPGTYTLSVLYQSIGADDITITVLPNIQPDFEIYSCASNKVSLSVTDKNYDRYFVDFGDASAVVPIPFGNTQVANHSYAASGNYPISIRGNNLGAADNCDPKLQNFTALLVLPAPTVNTLTALDPGNIRLDFSAAVHLQLHSEIAVNNASTFQLFKTLYGVASDTVSNIKVDDNYYCFRLSAFDPCISANTYSNIICSQKIMAVATSDVDKVAWVTSPTGVTDYIVSRDNTPIATVPAMSFDDTNITCNTNYCYRVTSEYANGSQSISLEKCVDAFTTKVPSAITDASSVVKDNQVSLTWLQDPLFSTSSYQIFRSLGSGPLQFYGTALTPDFKDADYNTSAGLCYRVTYADQCGVASPPGTIICPIRLSGTLDKKNTITLSWSGYKGWSNGVSGYVLEKLDKEGNLIATLPVGTDTVFVDDADDPAHQIVSYRVTATPKDPGLTASISNIARFTKEVNLFYPTAFTPNGDSLNDGFNVSGHYIATIELDIFDRWGTLIYSTNNNDPWDGTYNGKKMPETTYVWTAKITDTASRRFTHTGTIVLLNKRQ